MAKIDLDRLVPNGAEFTFEGNSFRVLPMTVREQVDFAKLIKDKKEDEIAHFLVQSAMKSIDSSLSMEDIDSIRNQEFLKGVLEAALKANNLKMDKNFQSGEDQSTSEQK